ncbi:MAG TPA: rRNA maturation RNase YbeY [Tissierellaceae bacterium]|nr:rRNA maturation RNase YbeY [Tissierellaceae bacterium]
MEVFIDNRQDKIKIEDDIYDLLQKVVEEVLTMEKKSLNYEISISFVDSDEIKNLNKHYRNINKETDVLSFPQNIDFVFQGPILLGDIIISTERALEQSKELGHSFSREIAYLTAHSMLHLLGYDHMDEEEKSIMRFKEKEIMKKINTFKNS